MKLNYKILWIDDQIEDYIDMGIKDELETHIESLGFTPTVECFENGRSAEESINKIKYDLILSDYNIEGANEQGDVLIQKIRYGGVFTEVLFYSAQPDFDTIAKNLYQDRVSFFSLIGDESFKGFKAKAFKLIDHTVSKLQELNSIRGLVMSETSELDNTVEEIIFSFLSKGNKESEKLNTYIVDSIISSAKSNMKNAEKFEKLDTTEIVKSRLFDADKKSRTINKILELLKIEDKKFIDFYKNYKTDVLDTRNDLAHAKSDTIDGIEYLIISRKDGEHPIKFNQEHCVQIRRNLRKHSDLLKSIREVIIK
jgi:CheY-like chemotaxis protein